MLQNQTTATTQHMFPWILISLVDRNKFAHLYPDSKPPTMSSSDKIGEDEPGGWSSSDFFPGTGDTSSYTCLSKNVYGKFDGKTRPKKVKFSRRVIDISKADSCRCHRRGYSVIDPVFSGDYTSSETTEMESTSEDKDEQLIRVTIDGDIERTLTLSVPVLVRGKDARRVIAKELNVEPEAIVLKKDGNPFRLRDYVFNGTVQGEPVNLTVEFGFKEDSSSDDSEPTVSIEPMITVFKTVIETPEDTKKYLEVTIHNQAFTKEYLGGYRNKVTKQIYYHAQTQTYLKRRGAKYTAQLTSRDVQTHLPYHESGMNTMDDKATQMWRPDLYIPTLTDVIVTANPDYVPYDTKNKTLKPLEAAVVIQRAWRHFLDRRKMERARALLVEKEKADLMFTGLNIKELHKHRLILLIKNSFPKGRGDFYDLYTALGQWYRYQKAQIKEYKSGFAYKAALCDIFEEFTKGLYAIESHRIRARHENLMQQNVRFLERNARDRINKYPKGNITMVTDLNIQRARELKEIYSSYKRDDVTVPERIDLLSTLKDAFEKMEAIDLTGDLISIIEREIDLLLMGVDQSKLEILRNRFESIFFHVLKDEDFNPEAKFYRKQIEKRGKHPLYRCNGCGKVKHPSYFFTHLRLKTFNYCMSCSWMGTTASATTNLAPYARILHNVRAKEKNKCCKSAIIFLLQPMGMYFIVNILWNGQSILSGSRYLPELTVTRWLPNEEWSPWNTILLTEKEASIHDAIGDPESFYTRAFILKVKNKHILARMHFTTPYSADVLLRKSGEWARAAKDEGFYTSRRHAARLDKFMPNEFFVESMVKSNISSPEPAAKVVRPPPLPLATSSTYFDFYRAP